MAGGGDAYGDGADDGLGWEGKIGVIELLGPVLWGEEFCG